MHIHTYYSDGQTSPETVVAEAKKNGVQLISITDHDTMLAYGEAKNIASAAGIDIVAGIEVSAYEGDVKLHTLGYNVDCESAAYRQFSDELVCGSLKRTEDIIFKLNKNGVPLKLEKVLNERADARSPVHAMHIARVGARMGYAKTPFSFYLDYLALGKCAYSRVCRPSPERAIGAIRESGGFASLAHPGRIELDKQSLYELIKKLSAVGLCGIEAVYSTHTAIETAYYKEIAKTFRLVVTGGSDTHYLGGSKAIGTPVFYVGEDLAEKLGTDLQ